MTSSVKVTNSCYCVRKLLNVPTADGTVHVFPVDKQVPFGAMKRYRQAMLDLLLRVSKVEQFMCSNRWDKIAHDKIPNVAGFRLRKGTEMKSVRCHQVHMRKIL